jgi:hypothetical protein
VLKTTDTLDTVGGFARSPADIRLLFDVIRVKGRDYPLVHERLQDFPAQDALARLRLGFLRAGLDVFAGFPQSSWEPSTPSWRTGRNRRTVRHRRNREAPKCRNVKGGTRKRERRNTGKRNA